MDKLDALVDLWTCGDGHLLHMLYM
jgi:hypothetical protein